MLNAADFRKKFQDSVDRILPLGNECWNEIESEITIRALDKDEFFSVEGEIAKELCLIVDGILRIYYLDENGNEWNKHFLTKNDFVASSISPEKSSITKIQALAKTELIAISYKKFIQAAKKFPQINQFMQMLTFNYLEQKQDREIRLLSEGASSHYMVFLKDFPQLETKLKDYHIASYLGITPTQLSRIRKKINKC